MNPGRILLTSLIIIFATGLCNAQVSLGMKGGPNFSTLEIYKRPSYRGFDIKSIQGFQLGAIMRYLSEKHAGLQVEFLYNQNGWRKISFNDESLDTTRTMDYLQMPVLTHFNIGKKNIRILLEGGVYLAYEVSSNTYYNDASGNEETEKYIFREEIDNRWDYGLIGRAGFQFIFSFGTLEAKAFYNYGYGNLFLDKSEAVEISQNRVYGINFSYLYTLGKKKED